MLSDVFAHRQLRGWRARRLAPHLAGEAEVVVGTKVDDCARLACEHLLWHCRLAGAHEQVEDARWRADNRPVEAADDAVVRAPLIKVLIVLAQRGIAALHFVVRAAPEARQRVADVADEEEQRPREVRAEGHEERNLLDEVAHRGGLAGSGLTASKTRGRQRAPAGEHAAGQPGSKLNSASRALQVAVARLSRDGSGRRRS